VTKQLFRKLWSDDQGALLAMEFLFMAVILVIGLVVGLVAVRNAITTELYELANSILALNTSYSFGGLTGCCASVDGSQAIDIPAVLPVSPTCVTPTVPLIVTVAPPC